MTKDEALHKALKVLNCLNNDRVYETSWVKGAINACEEALEKPEFDYNTAFSHGYEAHKVEQKEQKPVAWNEEEFNAIAYDYRAWPAQDIKGVSERYQALVDYVLNLTHPAKQLSDDEIIDLYFQASISPQPHESIIDFARAIEAKILSK